MRVYVGSFHNGYSEETEWFGACQIRDELVEELCRSEDAIGIDLKDTLCFISICRKMNIYNTYKHYK